MQGISLLSIIARFECGGVTCLQCRRGKAMQLQTEISVVANGDFRGEVGNLWTIGGSGG